jgi:hypothetical protein
MSFDRVKRRAIMIAVPGNFAQPARRRRKPTFA